MFRVERQTGKIREHFISDKKNILKGRLPDLIFNLLVFTLKNNAQSLLTLFIQLTRVCV
jgi:hypothetical protein